MKERGLRKSMGFHFDLALLGICTLVCSLTGLPWMCSATVQSLTHSSSLTVMKRHAPGERAQVDFVLEQRVTTICVALLTGLVFNWFRLTVRQKMITKIFVCRSLCIFGIFIKKHTSSRSFRYISLFGHHEHVGRAILAQTNIDDCPTEILSRLPLLSTSEVKIGNEILF